MPSGEEDRAREFYLGVLELEERPKPEDMAGRGGCWFETGGLKVHLGVEADFRPAKKAHPAILVSDFDQLVDRLATQGCETKTDVPVEGRRRIFVFDPFGNRIELIDAG